MNNAPYPKVVLVGKVNVGKSSLFNRISEEPKALVSRIPGTTRDRNYAQCLWQGKEFILIDIGGVEKLCIDTINKEVQKQIGKAIGEGDLILFVLDAREGLSNAERDIAKLIRKSGKPIISVLNKSDSQKWRQESDLPEYWRLGFGQPWPVSAVSGVGIGDLLDEVVKKLPSESKSSPSIKTQTPTKVAIVGRPNVGKSSLLNSLTGEERVIVSPIPHTTREPQDTLIYQNNRPLLLIDTAGIRKKSKIKWDVEKLGVVKSIEVIRRADIVLLVLDLTEQIGHQDKALADLSFVANRGIILVINKIDLEPKFDEKFNKFVAYYQNMLANISWAPIIFVSAKTEQNVDKIFDLIWQVKENRERKIENNELKEFLAAIIKNKKFDQKIWSKITLRQVGIKPPRFALSVPKIIIKRKLLHQAQLNIIEKELRKKWPFEGTPIIIRKIENRM